MPQDLKKTYLLKILKRVGSTSLDSHYVDKDVQLFLASSYQCVLELRSIVDDEMFGMVAAWVHHSHLRGYPDRVDDTFLVFISWSNAV